MMSTRETHVEVLLKQKQQFYNSQQFRLRLTSLCQIILRENIGH